MLSGRSRRDSGSRDLPPFENWQRHSVLNRDTSLQTEWTSDDGCSMREPVNFYVNEHSSVTVPIMGAMDVGFASYRQEFNSG